MKVSSVTFSWTPRARSSRRGDVLPVLLPHFTFRFSIKGCLGCFRIFATLDKAVMEILVLPRCPVSLGILHAHLTFILLW